MWAVAQVEWTVIGGEQVETLLSNLLYNEHNAAVRVRPSRRDLGIDVLVPVRVESEQMIPSRAVVSIHLPSTEVRHA
jgi:hypothetical protein